MAAGRTHVDFALAVASWLAGQRSDHTRDAYRRDLERYVEWWASRRDGSPLETVSADLDAYRDAVAGSRLSEATVARRLASMGSFFAHATSRGLLDVAPRPAVPAPAGLARAPRALTRTEINQLSGAAVALGGRHHVLLALLLFDKRRLGEILAYDVDDVHLGKGRATVTGGTGAAWVADPRTVTALRAHVTGRPAGPLLASQSNGRRLSRFGADFLLRQVSEQARISPTVSANGLRRADPGPAS